MTGSVGPDDPENIAVGSVRVTDVSVMYGDSALAIVLQYRKWAEAGKLTPEAQKIYDQAVGLVNAMANKHMPAKFSKEGK